MWRQDKKYWDLLCVSVVSKMKKQTVGETREMLLEEYLLFSPEDEISDGVETAAEIGDHDGKFFKKNFTTVN